MEMLPEKEGFEMSFEGEVWVVVSQASEESVPQFGSPSSEGVFPNVLGAGNQQLHRRAVRAEQPSLALQEQAFK